MVGTSRGTKLLERTRARSGAMRWRRAERGPESPAPLSEPAHAYAVYTHDGDSGVHALADPPLDLAVYQCSCGYVFEAAVSTAVTCPHCASQQAW